jgi:hypothetical protein
VKRALWVERWGKKLECQTLREVAIVTGKMLFFQLMALVPFSCSDEGRHLILTLSNVGKEASTRGWDALLLGKKESTLSTIQKVWDIAINPDRRWSRDSCPPIAQIQDASLIVASDSSRRGYGYEIFRRVPGESILAREEKRKVCLVASWPPKDDERTIFIKEMEAAVKAIQRSFEEYPDEKVILLACDNTAVCFCLKSGVANVPEAQTLIDKIDQFLTRVIVIAVVSKDNPADCHSRGSFWDFEERVSRLSLVVREIAKGRRVGMPDRFVRTGAGGGQRILRHEPEDVEECPLDGMIEDEEIDV